MRDRDEQPDAREGQAGRVGVVNGRYVARACNTARGIRDDFDPATEYVRLRQATN